MRIFFLLLLLLFNLNVGSEANQKTKLQESKLIEYHDNGNLKKVVHYLGKKKHGSEIYYSANGIKILELTFINSIQDGPETHYYPSPKVIKKALINYKSGLKEGKMMTWHKNGRLSGIAYFKNGHHDNISRAWHENGNIKAVGFFKNGLQDGLEIQYFKNGKKRGSANFKKGKIEGLETQWYESGVKKSEIIFKNSIATKQQKYWSKNGLLLDAKSLNDFQQNKKFSH